MDNRGFGGRTERHFGNAVDRGGRMGPGGSETTGRASWGWDSSGRAEERGPHWGKGPKGYKRNDERTRDDVCDAIAFQGTIDATDVEVKVESGVVTLTGTVALREQKRALERLVERCRGVHEVRNELRLSREGASSSSSSATQGKNARA